MQLVLFLSLLTGACALQVDFTPPNRVSVGDSLTVRCSTDKNDVRVWALHLSFRNASNSFQILRRTDGSASVFLTSDGYPMQFETSMSYRGGIEVEKSRNSRQIQLKLRINAATNGSKVTCTEMLFGSEKGDRLTRSIVVFQKPKVVLILVQRDSSKKNVSEITAVMVGTKLDTQCQADFGAPPARSLTVGLISGSPVLKGEKRCTYNNELGQKICSSRWTLSIEKTMNQSLVGCGAKDEKEVLYESKKTKIQVFESVSLMMEGNVYACDRSADYETTILVKTRPKVKDVVSPLIEETQGKIKDCNIINWRLRRNIGYYSRTGEKVIQMKRDWSYAFVNLNGSFVTSSLDEIRGLKFHLLKLNDNFFHVKGYANIVDIFGDQ